MHVVKALQSDNIITLHRPADTVRPVVSVPTLDSISNQSYWVLQ